MPVRSMPLVIGAGGVGDLEAVGGGATSVVLVDEQTVGAGACAGEVDVEGVGSAGLVDDGGGGGGADVPLTVRPTTLSAVGVMVFWAVVARNLLEAAWAGSDVAHVGSAPAPLETRPGQRCRCRRSGRRLWQWCHRRAGRMGLWMRCRCRRTERRRPNPARCRR